MRDIKALVDGLPNSGEVLGHNGFDILANQANSINGGLSNKRSGMGAVSLQGREKRINPNHRDVFWGNVLKNIVDKEKSKLLHAV